MNSKMTWIFIILLVYASAVFVGSNVIRERKPSTLLSLGQKQWETRFMHLFQLRNKREISPYPWTFPPKITIRSFPPVPKVTIKPWTIPSIKPIKPWTVPPKVTFTFPPKVTIKPWTIRSIKPIKPWTVPPKVTFTFPPKITIGLLPTIILPTAAPLPTFPPDLIG
ncbi:adhesive plaque matrix protein [Lingula anatina]|uniref:Adhesive plaque matrix protein n=1 Tax=Lingula anatina TaxID=7574 RepID=A0A1S3IX93_LINAN|nr:adhesive plaque matrix protein [Lingula anatina]|eukprot:XP_013402169.1 adhesive plaque matrix protein [Lingula anatina]